VTIWYDVSDLVAWKLPHLTGIQRTTVGILNGLVEQGEPVELVRYDGKSGRFCTMSESELPSTVRCHLHGFATTTGASAAEVAAPAAPPAAKPGAKPARRRLKLFKKGFFFGGAGETEELRHAFRQFKTAARQLRKSVGHWATRRLRRAVRSGGHSSPPPAMRAAAVPGGSVRADVASFMASGDVFVSAGATWCNPGHVDAASSIRSRGVKVVRMIYDLIPTIKPHWLDPSHTKAITAWVRSVLLESDCVLTISEFSRQEIERYCAECRFDVPPITVVRLGDVLGDASGRSTPAPLPRFAPARPFFVCVSTLDVRKNHRLLYDAWTQLAAHRGDQCPDLVCIGTPHLYVADLLREIRQDRTVNRHIHVLHGIEDCELDWYYNNCQATIYPSKYEGWGLPVAESLGHGRLCLASNATSIPEISSDLPEFFDPFDVHGLVGLVQRVLDEPEWVRDREATIRETFRPTGWHETAAQVLAAINAPAGQGSRTAWPRLSRSEETVEPAVFPMGRTLKAA
jgi:glycosyltransferase involved in cell wall biosynthesis